MGEVPAGEANAVLLARRLVFPNAQSKAEWPRTYDNQSAPTQAQSQTHLQPHGKPKFTAPAAMVELFGVGPCSPTILQTMGRHECLIVRCYCAGDQPEQNIIRIGDMQDNCFSLRAICIKLQPVAL